MKYALLLCAALLTGCASVGPLDPALFNQRLVAATPAEEGSIYMSGPSEWWPNAKGFSSLKAAPLSGLSPFMPGVLVITDRSILFQQWDEDKDKFSIVKKISFGDMQEITLDEYGRGRLIVVRGKEYQHDSFSFFNEGSGMINGPKTEAGYKYLSEIAGKRKK